MENNKYGIALDTTSTNFKLHQRQFALTYANIRINKEDLVEWFSTNFYDLKMFGVCWETYKQVDENDDAEEIRYHTHFLISCVKQPLITNSRKFDWIDANNNVYHPNIKKIFTSNHFNSWCSYIFKEDETPYTNIKDSDLDKNLKTSQLRNIIQSKKSWKEVVMDDEICFEIQRHLNWAKMMFVNRPPPKAKCSIKWKDLMPYQKMLYKHCKTEPKERQIIWVYSPVTKQGKSTFIKYLNNKFSILRLNTSDIEKIAFLYNNEDIVVFDLSWAKSKDIENSLQEYFNDDIPLNRFNSMFDCLERLSNQDILTSSKYESKTSAFNSHIFVLSNCSPEYVGEYLPNRIYPVIASLSDGETIPQPTMQSSSLGKTPKPEILILDSSDKN